MHGPNTWKLQFYAKDMGSLNTALFSFLFLGGVVWFGFFANISYIKSGPYPLFWRSLPASTQIPPGSSFLCSSSPFQSCAA